jgi:hypothetical protein
MEPAQRPPGIHVARLAKSGVGVAAPMGPVPTQNRGRVKVRITRISTVAAPSIKSTVPISAAPNSCKACGAKVVVRKRVYCDACFPEQMAAHAIQSRQRFSRRGR